MLKYLMLITTILITILSAKDMYLYVSFFKNPDIYLFFMLLIEGFVFFSYIFYLILKRGKTEQEKEKVNIIGGVAVVVMTFMFLFVCSVLVTISFVVYQLSML